MRKLVYLRTEEELDNLIKKSISLGGDASSIVEEVINNEDGSKSYYLKLGRSTFNKETMKYEWFEGIQGFTITHKRIEEGFGAGMEYQFDTYTNTNEINVDEYKIWADDKWCHILFDVTVIQTEQEIIQQQLRDVVDYIVS